MAIQQKQNKAHPWSDMPTVEVELGNYFQFKKINDGIAGTVVDMALEVENTKLKRIEDRITILTEHGYYHNKEGQKIDVDTGAEMVCTFAYKPTSPISKKIRKLKLGQIVAFVYINDIDTKQVNPFKNIEVFSDGSVNEEWVKENASSPLEAAKKIFG